MKIVNALLLLAASSIEGQHLHGSSPKLNVNDMLQDNHLMTNDMEDAFTLKKKDKCIRIKLYWEKGYRWQESKKEKKWCMEGHKKGETLEIKKCGSSSKQKFMFISGDRIQSCKNKDLCFVLSGGKFAKLDKCSSSNSKQKFKKNGSDKKFALEPKSKKGCLTQRHHPKSGERVRIEKCKTAAKDDTKYWNKY